MKVQTIIFLFLINLPNLIIGQEPSPEAEAFFQKAMAGINTKHTTWIRTTAAEVNSKNRTTDDVNKMAADYGRLSGLNSMDIMALAFLVMMQAAKSAQEDLKAIMAQVKSINNQKKQIRDAQKYFDDSKQTVNRVIIDSFKRIATQQAVSANQPVRTQTITTKTVNTRVTASEINEVKEKLKNKLDSLNEMSEMTSLRLQMMMDRRSKFMSTLSNIMKKISDTQNTIVQNLK